MTNVLKAFAGCIVVAAFAAAGCGSSSGGGGGTTPPVRPTASPTPPGQKIQHVVILIQENRTVDALFNGFPGADTVKQGLGQDLNDPGKQITIPLKQMPLEMNLTPKNTHQQFLTAYDGGKMDGFNTIEVEHNPGNYVTSMRIRPTCNRIGISPNSTCSPTTRSPRKAAAALPGIRI